MEYVSGIYALNLPSPDGTPGDWHFSALDWRNVLIKDTESSPFGDFMLHAVNVPGHGTMLVACDVRACLDLIEQGSYGSVQGMREDFIDDERYTPIIFSKVALLKDHPDWNGIDAFMGREYLCDWLDFKEREGL